MASAIIAISLFPLYLSDLQYLFTAFIWSNHEKETSKPGLEIKTLSREPYCIF